MEFADYAPQVIWLILCFGCLYILMSRLVLPRVSEILENRQRKLDHDIESAEKLRNEAASALAEYEEAMRNAALQAENIISEAREKLKMEAERRLDALDKHLDEQAVVSGERLSQLGLTAEAEVRKAAEELVPLTVSKLIEVDVSPDEVTQAIQAASEGR
ncbi:MAG: hypothetical protein VX884_02705 [Pseudomonadota bacterium]|nr:hypothetical protein [Pseudomonadota bacterium]